MGEQGKPLTVRLFEDALRVESSKRREFLRQACEGDEGLLSELESKLAEHERAYEDETLPIHSIDTGETVGQRFQIVRFIGRGGMGDVYEANDMLPSRPRRVALKVIRPEIASRGDVVRQFEREIALGQMITHPNVCRIYDIGFHQETPDGDPMLFLTMELLHGQTLARRLRERGPMRVEEALPLLRQLADALDAAHRVNVVHRDFKPSNIMLVQNRGSETIRVVVTDFGLAAELADLGQGTVWGSGVGTPDYMSPEQVRGELVGPSCDIYAFGVVIYEMLTGKLPFEGETPLHRMAKRLNESPIPPRTFAGSLPRAWNSAILRCLESNPAKRFQRVQDVVTTLEDSAPARGAGWKFPSARLAAYVATLLIVLVLAVLAIRKMGFPGGGSPGQVHSIAVLPFENVGGDAEWQYWADGMTESMINRLSRIGDLEVMSRSAVFRIRKTELDPIEQGRKLKVDAILTGSVRHDSKHLEASIALVDCATGRHIWGQKYRQVFVDPLTFEKSAVEDTAAQLRAHLSEAEKRRVLHDYTENTNAYRLYLKGRYEWNRRTPQGLGDAIRNFQQALAADPSYALAYAGLADAYAGQVGILPAERFGMAAAAAERALQIDPDLPEAHTSLGFMHVQYDWDWPKAEAEFLKAIELNPSYPTAHSMYAQLLCALGRFDEAQAEVGKAQKLDPLSMGIANGVGFAYYLARDFDRAEKQFRISLALTSNPVTSSYLALTHTAAGRTAEAIKEYERIVAADPTDLDTTADLIRAYSLAGRQVEALRTYRQLLTSPKDHEAAPTSMAGASAALHRLDDAFSFLDRAYADRFWYLIFLKVEPLFDPLREDPRYRALLRKMNLAG